MRALRYASYAAAIGLFLFFQGMNLARTARQARIGAYSRSLIEFLGMRGERERYLLIKTGGKPQGYSGLRVERILNERDARYRVTIEGYAELGNSALDAELTLNDQGQILTATADLTVAGTHFEFAGKKDGSEVALVIRSGGMVVGSPLRFPAELGIGGTVFPIPPLGALRVGEERTIPYFDALTRREATCIVRVRGRKEISFAGFRLEAFDVEVTTPTGRFEVLTAPDGEVLSVTGPGGIQLRRATSLEVRGLYSKKRRHGHHSLRNRSQ